MPLITFIVPVSDSYVYQQCFLGSPLFRKTSDFQIIGQAGFRNAATAFNDGLDKAASDLIVCSHQDVVIPTSWAKRFLTRLEELDSLRVPVGVVGCGGITSQGLPIGHFYRHDREFLAPLPLPARVETLDEMLISFRKGTGLRFDAELPSFFSYATDLCLQAAAARLQNYVVDAPCFHQAHSRLGKLPRGFFEGRNYLCEKWRAVLPVQTLSGPLDHKRSYLVYRLKEWIRKRMPRPVSYSPSWWWEDLRKIDPDDILLADRDQREQET